MSGKSLEFDIQRYGLTINDMLAPRIVSAIESAMTVSLAVIKDKWQSEAQQKLNSTRPLYLMGLDFNSIIYPYGGDSFAGAVELQGKFPNMLESGFSAFDMKVGFSKSSKKIPTKSGGWYLTIPMRHSTPGSFMYGKPMPKNIYKQAKTLNNGGSLSVKGGQQKSWTGYQYKSNIYDGLTRIIKDYGKTKQSQYFTFRRVSNNSDPMSWQHPGYVGVKLAEQLTPFALTTFSRELDRALSSL